MRRQAVALVLALLGVLGGGALIGIAALGACLIFDSLVVGWWAVFGYDDGKPAPQVHQVPGQRAVSLADVLNRSRAS